MQATLDLRAQPDLTSFSERLELQPFQALFEGVMGQPAEAIRLSFS
jgi:hypothetical protein